MQIRNRKEHLSHCCVVTGHVLMQKAKDVRVYTNKHSKHHNTPCLIQQKKGCENMRCIRVTSMREVDCVNIRAQIPGNG